MMTQLALALCAVAATVERLPITGLPPARIVPNLTAYHYRVSTASPECQAFCDQASGYYHSYVWIEAARSFETAVKHDPECAFAWLGLHNALEKWDRAPKPREKPDTLLALAGGFAQPSLPLRFQPFKFQALERARELMSRANHREALLIQAKLQETGRWPNTPDADRRKRATATLDELLALHGDDQEGWFARALIADGKHASAPFHQALLRLNPLHPGANHELVHFYENIERPALGWPYAEKYIQSSPGLPHAFHMQSHLAMRIGKWQQTTDWSWKAIELQRAYHAAMNLPPAEDHQYRHHLETLTRSLVHDGRFAEARQIRAEAERRNYHFRPEWLRMAILSEDWADAEQLVAPMIKSDRAGAAYWAGLAAIARGNLSHANEELKTLKKGFRALRQRETRIWELEGRLRCLQGDGDAGLAMLRKAVDKTKNDYRHHAWGNGAVLMEAWGESALACGNAAEADEAFQEALAHDAGSVIGALGMWALCERLGRHEQADRFLKVARKCWARADSDDFERLKCRLATLAENISTGQ